jgi:hypothetical protein
LGIRQASELEVTLRLDPDPPIAGIPFHVIAGVRNRGPGTASAVVLTVTVPAGLRTARLPSGCSRVSSGVSCDIGTLAPGERAERRVTMRARDITPAEFGADARSDSTDTRASGTGARLRTVVFARGAQAAPALPPPRVGEVVNLYRARGRVLVRLPGRRRFIPVARARQIPVGTIVNARRGRVQLVTAIDAAGTLQTGLFYSGAFRLTQSRATGLSTLALALGSFRDCPAITRRSRAAQREDEERGRGRRVRYLWARAKGRFRTRGNASSATIRGTTWLTADHCAGTLTRVRVSVVVVRDFVRARTVILRAGQEYFAPLSRSRRGERSG